MNYCQLCLIEARIREEERQKRMNRWKWVGMYFMVFVVWFTLLLLWGKGVIG